MGREIDCLLIGPYEPSFSRQEKVVGSYGTTSPAYRDLNLSFLQYNGKFYRLLDFLELLLSNQNNKKNPYKYLNIERIPSGAVVYLGSYLHKRGLTFDYINSFLYQKKELAEKLQDDNILTIALITTTYLNPFPLLEILSFIRKYNTRAKVIIGGPFIWSQIRIQTENNLYSMFKSLDADLYVHSSQGEATLVKIIRALKNDLPFHLINNIYYKCDGKYISTPLDNENNKLTENMVDWSLFTDKLQKHMWIRTSLSCAFRCSFCDFPIRLPTQEYLSVEFIEQELDAIKQTGKVLSIRFIDDTFNIPKKRFKEILRMMIRNKYKFKWSSYFRCQYVDREMIELMVESGCEAVHLGIESGNPQILKNMNKKATVEQYEKGLALLNEYGIISFASFIIGFPGETSDTAKDTVSFIENNKPTFYLLWPWFCLPSTPIWQERERYNLNNWGFNWKHSTMDSNRAMDIIEDIFLSIKNSVYCSFYVEYITLLFNQGISLKKILNFSKAFNKGVQEKLTNQNQKEVSTIIVEKMRNSIL